MVNNTFVRGHVANRVACCVVSVGLRKNGFKIATHESKASGRFYHLIRIIN